jgi:hypothetical protein
MASGDKNKGKSKNNLQDAIENAGKNAQGPGTYTVKIVVEVGNPKVNEYLVEIVPGG